MKQTSSDKPTLRQRIRCFISYAHDWKFIDDWRCELQKCVLCKAERFVD